MQNTYQISWKVRMRMKHTLSLFDKPWQKHSCISTNRHSVERYASKALAISVSSECSEETWEGRVSQLNLDIFADIQTTCIN